MLNTAQLKNLCFKESLSEEEKKESLHFFFIFKELWMMKEISGASAFIFLDLCIVSCVTQFCSVVPFN